MDLLNFELLKFYFSFFDAPIHPPSITYLLLLEKNKNKPKNSFGIANYYSLSLHRLSREGCEI